MDDRIFYLLLVAVVAYMLYRLIKHGGFKNALFGARIIKTFGAITGQKSGITNVIKVHSLESANEAEIGIEIVSKGFGSWSMQPINITKKDAKKLSQYLEKAASE